MKDHLPSAAKTALHRLWNLALPLYSLGWVRAAGAVWVGAFVSGCWDDSPRPAPPSEPIELPELVIEPEADEEAPPEELPVLDAALAAWSVELEAFAIDGAAFLGDELVVAASALEGLVLVRYTRAPHAVTPVERDRLVLKREGASPIRLVRLEDRLVAVWTAQGQLEALVIQGGVALADSAPRLIAPEEGGAFDGPPVVTAREDQALACVRDGARPLCIAFDRELATRGLFPFERRRGERPELLSATRDGHIVVFGRCRSESCPRKSLEAVTLDADGNPIGRARPLPEVQAGRTNHSVATDQGLVLIARRVGAGEHSAWHITPNGVLELDGRFSRAVGGFPLEDRVLLVERAHLRMRKGFPVAGYNLRPLSFERRKALRHEKRRVERAAFPEAIARSLPTEVDQTFSANEDALLFATPRRKGKVRASIVRLPSGSASDGVRPGGT